MRTPQRVHYIGIGGAGMSALARITAAHGTLVSGSDAVASPVLESLSRELGVRLAVGQSAGNVGAADVVVASAAIKPDNPELVEARTRGIPVLSRASMLGRVMDAFQARVAVSGTHGKTTTTAMIAAALEAAGMDPTALVGADVPAWGSNARVGGNHLIIAEACEAFGSFLELKPTHSVITNIEADHLDHYGDFDHVADAFRQFARRTSVAVVVCAVGGADRLVAAEAGDRLVTYGWRGADLSASSRAGGYEVTWRGRAIGRLTPGLPGAHNALNALGATAVCLTLGASFDAIASAIAAFTGAERRFQVIGALPDGGVVVDDYAHHPTEVRATLAAARERYPGRRIVALFQPHLPSRTRDLMDEFADAFVDADRVFVTDIYLAREEPIPGVDSARLADAIARRVGAGRVEYAGDLDSAASRLRDAIRPGDVVLTLGAGDVYQAAAHLAPSRASESTQGREQSMIRSKLAVAVITGGRSSERDISLVSAARVRESLDPSRYDVTVIDSASVADLISLAECKPDVAFVAQHGAGGEDGAIQGLLETLGIRYTGSGILASALALDKLRAKEFLAACGVRTPRAVGIRRELPYKAPEGLSLPVVVKPNSVGSSDGLSIVREPGHLVGAIEYALTFDRTVLVEEYISGTEITGAVIGNAEPQVLPLVEIVPKSGVYDRHAKYTPGATDEICPARLPEAVAARARALAAECHWRLGCRGMSRTDMIVAGDGEVFFIETNTVPGMTQTSLLPCAAAAAGLSFGGLLDRLIELALEEECAK